MDLMPNTTFRIIKELKPTTNYLSGIYRAILDEPSVGKTIGVLIEPEDAPPVSYTHLDVYKRQVS